MQRILLDIHIPADRLLALYQGRANRILLKARDGRSVSLPAHHLRPYFGHEGVHGTFELQVSDSGELLGLRRLA